MSDLLRPCLKSIFFEDREYQDPLFQVVEIKEMPPKEGSAPRYKLAINDGTNYCPAVLSSTCSSLIANKELEPFQIIKAIGYSYHKDKRILILTNIQVLPEKYPEVIGDPSSLNAKGNPVKEDSEERKYNNNTVQEQRNPSPPPPPKRTVAPPPVQKPKPSRPPNSASYLSISSLTSYIPGWSILARVVQKGPIKQWSNQKSNGKLFSIVLKDKNEDEIKGTFFNDEVDKFNDVVLLDKVYVISGGRIKNANKKYSSVNHDYEITFDRTTTFEECTDSNTGDIGEISYNFTKLRDLANKEEKSFVDVIAVIVSIQETEEIHSNKNDKTYTKRTITLTDDSDATIECTLWDDDAINFSSSNIDQVIRIKNAKVGEFHGKNISTTQSSILMILDRSIPEANELYDWYSVNKENVDSFEKVSSGGGSGDFQSQMIYLDQVNTNNLGKSDKTDYFSAFVSLKDIPMGRNIYYLACPRPECRFKSVTLEGDKYICNSCKNTTDEPVPRFRFNAQFGDFSGSAYFSIMGDDGKNIIGCTADEWVQQTDTMEEPEKQKLVRPLLFKDFKIRGRAKTDTYNNEDRVRLTISSITEIDYADASKFYAAEIDKFEN